MTGFIKRTIGAKTNLVAAAILLGALTPAAACSPTKVWAVSQTPNTNQTTTSDVFVDIPGTATTINQGGAASGCVIVDFSAMVNTSANVALYLTVLLDGKLGAPQFTQLIYNNSTFEAREASFVFWAVSPGTHHLRFQFHSSMNGQAVRISSSNIIIHYVP